MPRYPSLTAGAILLFASASAAGDVPGDFDFYVLALSWSPGYCATDDDPDALQCGAEHGFVVHGLWPEYESGWPEYCPSDLPHTLSLPTVAAVSDFMPGADQVAHQWRKHGLCSGLDAEAYFALMRRAAARVTIPATFHDDRPASRSPAAIEAAFAAANPGLSQGAMSVQCRDGAFTEIRICMTKELAFRPCAEVDAARCRMRSLAIPSAD